MLFHPEKVLPIGLDYFYLDFAQPTGINMYRTRANKGRRHYSRIMFWGLRLLHKNDINKTEDPSVQAAG